MSEVLNEPIRSLQIVDTLSMGGAETWLKVELPQMGSSRLRSRNQRKRRL